MSTEINFTPEQQYAKRALIDELERRSRGGTNVEPSNAAMYRSVLDYGGELVSGYIGEVASEVMVRRGVLPGPAASLARTAMIRFFTEASTADGAEFDDSRYTSIEDWLPHIARLRHVLRDRSSPLVHALYSPIIAHTASTPPTQRASAIDIMAQSIKEGRFSESGIVGLSYGCSIGSCELQLAYKDEFPLAIDSVRDGVSGEDVTTQALRVLSRPSVFDLLVGVDRFPFYYEKRQKYDVGATRFALAGLRPSERNNREYMARQRALLAKKEIDNPGYDPDSPFRFYSGDFLKAGELEHFRRLYPEPFQIIIASQVTQEMPPRDQVRLHYALCDILSEDGALIYVSQAYLAPWNVTQPAPVKNLRDYMIYTLPYRNRIHMVDKLIHPYNLQHMADLYDNRGMDMIIRSGKIAMNGGLEAFSDVIKDIGSDNDTPWA